MPLDVGGTGKETGWLSKWAFQLGALAADAIGRQAVADGYLYESKLRAVADNSLNAARVARYTYDFDVSGGVAGAIPLTGDALPAKALILGGMMVVATPLTGAGGTTAGIRAEALTDIIADAAVAGAPWSLAGNKDIIPVATALTAVQLTTSKTPALVVTTHDLTAGKFNLFLFYVVTD